MVIADIAANVPVLNENGVKHNLLQNEKCNSSWIDCYSLYAQYVFGEKRVRTRRTNLTN